AFRLNASCPCTYTRFDEGGIPYDQRPSKTLDLSLEGVKLQTSFPVHLGEMLKITMALGEDLVTFRGQVVHVKRSVDEGFNLGLSIKDIGKIDKIALTRYIYYFKSSKPTQ
nr:hypothetical protein [candidate division Zixibacteria bacterium]